MSLATRCTACGTVFRVVQDQLKVSEGWVRCGRCDAVFNALEGLFDLERDAPPDWPAIVEHDAVQPAPNPEVAHSASAAESVPIGNRPPGPVEPDQERAGLPQSQASELPASDEALTTQGIADRGLPNAPDSNPDAEAPTPSMPMPTPNFLRDASGPPRWQGRRGRLVLSGAAVLLLATLNAQVTHHFRDLVSARWPVVRPAMTSWCNAVGCSIEAARRIEDISVESTALTRAASPDSFRLSVALRNRGKMDLALPSLELSLTDSSGQLMARRALGPPDFRDAAPTIAPGAEAALQLTLATGSPRVTGYTVEIFYP